VLSDRCREARLSLFSKAAGGHSAISLMQSISAYESNTPRLSHKFHPHLCTNWCVQILVLSTYTSRLEHCLLKSISSTRCLQASQLIWSSRLSHDTPAVKGNAHCWIFAEELKIKPKMHWNRPHCIWGITLNSLLQVYRKLPYPIPVALGIRYRTCSVFNDGYGTVPADTS